MSDSIHSRAMTIEGLMQAGNLEYALKLIHDTVETIITEPICTSQVYSSAPLDALAQKIGTLIFESQIKVTAAPGDTMNTYVYIATKLQRSGGHTRLMRDFIFARPDARHIILLTDIAGTSATAWLADTFAHVKNYACHHAPRSGYVATVQWLQTQLLQHAPTHTYLFNHHEDVTIIAAVVPGLNLQASFCHHGDHHLTLGIHLPHVTHLDFHPTGFHRCRSDGIANRYISFAVAAEPTRFTDDFIANGSLTTCTVAGKNKVETPYPLRYVEVVPAILAATGGIHIHIGKLSHKGLATITKEIKKRNIPTGRFIYIPWVQNIREVLLDKKVDLYLSSFPLGGGLTTVEVMSAGIPLVVHKHMLTRELGGLDIAYPGVFAWQKVSELTEYLSQLTPRELSTLSAQSRAHYLRYYSEPLRVMLDNPAREAPALTAEFAPKLDEWGLWVAQQVNISHVLYRFAYRRSRQFRGWYTRIRTNYLNFF